MINEYIETHDLTKRTLNKVSTGFLFASLLWLFRSEPDIAKKIARVMLPKDYIRFTLTGEISSEPSDACSTGVFDIPRGEWLFELCEAFGIPQEIFPAITGSSDRVGCVTRRAASETGIPEGVPVAAGGGDQPMQSVGNGIIDAGKSSSNIGTAGQFCVPLTEPIYDVLTRTNTFSHAIKNRWYMLGAILSAGHSVKWFWREILRGGSYSDAAALAAESPRGSRGLLWCPWLNGDRMYNAPHARAMFIGLTGTHTRADMMRSVMEGVVFSLRQGLEIIRSCGVVPANVISSGGGARSALWRQIQADVYNLPLRTALAEEQACAGAAIMGGVAAGVFSSVDEGCAQMVKISDEVVCPIPSNAAAYDELFGIWSDIYRSTDGLLARLAALDEKK